MTEVTFDDKLKESVEETEESTESVLIKVFIKEFPTYVAEVMDAIATIKKDDGMVDTQQMVVTYLQSKLGSLRAQSGRKTIKKAESPLTLMRNLSYLDKLKAEELTFEIIQSYLADYYHILGRELTLTEPEVWITEKDFNRYMKLRAKCSPSHLKNGTFPLSLQYLLSRPRALAIGTKFSGFLDSAEDEVDFAKEEKLIAYIKYNTEQKRKRDGVVMLHDLYFKEYKAKVAERKAIMKRLDEEVEWFRNRYREQKAIDLGEKII